MQTIKKAFLPILFSLLLIVLCSCTEGETPYPPATSLTDNQMFLYDPFTYKLGIYDLETLEWTEIDAQGAIFLGFDWGNIYPYYTVGNTGMHKFYVGKQENTSLRFYFESESENEALVPFATDGRQFYYIAEQMNITPCKKRIITISDEGKAELVYNADGVGIMDGVMIGNDLYYTSPCEDGSGNSKVWRLNLAEKSENRQPVLIKEAYADYKLYAYKNQVLYVDTEKKLLFNDDIAIHLTQPSTEIWVDDESELLVEKYVTADGDLEMCFTDISTGRSLGVYKDAVNFKKEGNLINIYGNGFTERLDLSEEKTYGIY